MNYFYNFFCSPSQELNEEEDDYTNAELQKAITAKNVVKKQKLPKRRLFQTPDEPLGSLGDSELEEIGKKEKETKAKKDVFEFVDEFAYREEEEPKQKRGRKRKQHPPKIGSVSWMLNRMVEMEQLVKK